jgi:F0F1-type ATP synthase assembly protein I
MAARKTLQRLQALIWALIYGGLLTLVLGIATARLAHALGWGFILGGALAAAVGVALIAVRAGLVEEQGPG